MVQRGEFVRIRNVLHVFVSSMNFWVLVSSTPGLCHVKDSIGLNAPVSYATAVQAYLFTVSNMADSVG